MISYNLCVLLCDIIIVHQGVSFVYAIIDIVKVISSLMFYLVFWFVWMCTAWMSRHAIGLRKSQISWPCNCVCTCKHIWLCCIDNNIWFNWIGLWLWAAQLMWIYLCHTVQRFKVCYDLTLCLCSPLCWLHRTIHNSQYPTREAKPV